MMKRILSLLLVLLMVVSMLPTYAFAVGENDVAMEATEQITQVCETCGNDPCTCEGDGQEETENYDSHKGKYVKLNEAVSIYTVGSAAGSGFSYYPEDFTEDTILRIADWKVVGDVLWYLVEFYRGSIVESSFTADFPAEPWFQQTVDSSTNALVFLDTCETCGKPDCETEHIKCDICGKYECKAVHFWCETCEKYDCGIAHVYCGVCKTVDCGKTHTWCGICGDFDCGIQHEDLYKPDATPVIPENPTMTQGADVSVTDAYGDPVTAEGFTLTAGMKSSLSAWTALTGGSYQWQICYDDANDRWADILGQTGKGMLVSPAMILSIAGENGAAKIRCKVTSGDAALTSAAIPVRIAQPLETSAFTLNAGIPEGLAEGDGTDLEKNYVVVQYLYADGRTAATSDFAELIPGAAYAHSYTLPVIPGYKATLNTHSFDTSVQIVDGALVMNFAENVLTEKYTIFTVTYEPDFVSYTVIHYWQNVDNDNYTEHERETITATHKTGDVITDAHKSYPGFYNLLYETPAAAADGSTVIEVYYDRYYYLMTFELGENGYGVDPIYARYGADLEIGTPTRAGYTFQGWNLNGAPAKVPTTMPAENREYVAQWQAADTAKVSVVIWGENPDDEQYSYQKTIEIDAKPGDTISWDSWCFSSCTKVAHTHNALCGYNCGLEEHIHNSNCYELTCTTKEHTSHIDTCYACGRQEHEHSDSCCKYGGTSFTHWRHSDNCCTVGGEHTHSSSCGYNCTLHTHSVADGCYTAVCGKDEHPHTADCGYACGVTEEHVHTTACGTDQSGMKSNLWTLVRSETVTVLADGSTVLNVYYDRTHFTLTFIKEGSGWGSSDTTIKTITDKWGADIHSEFPIKNGNNTMWWTVPSNCDSMKPGTEFGSLDTMPAENITFTYDDETQAATLHYYVEALPGEDGKKASEIYSGFTNGSIDGTKKFKSYKDINVTTSGSLTYTEEFHNIIGFRQYVSYPEFDKHEQGGTTDDIKKDNYLLYARNGFDIVFYNPSELIKTEENVPYQMPLDSYDWTPTADKAPVKYEPGSVQFAGWYLNPEGTGARFDFSTNTMPAGPNNTNGETALALYAKWEPVEYKVNYYLTRDSLNRGENIPAEMTRLVNEAVAAGVPRPANDPYTVVFAEDIVKHGAYIGDPGDPKVSEGYEKIHPRAGYDFIGWFYLNEKGEETAFDPENMPVHQDLDLYGKWSSDVLCKYNVYFALDNNGDGIADTQDGQIVYVADPIAGSAIAGRTYTFAAKGGEDLYDGYREGYFPTVGSHSIVIDITDLEGTDANSFTFLYKPKAAVHYTVKYIDKDTGKELFDDKVVEDNRNVVVTENFVYIQGYMPDAYQKTLVVTDDNNETNDVIIFYYTKDNTHALYVVNYYIQQLDADLNHTGWIKYTDLQQTGDIGSSYTADAITIDGFTLSSEYTDDYNVEKKINGAEGTKLPTDDDVSRLADGKLSGKLTDKGMELNFYYTRNLYPYEFRYMLNGTTTELAEPKYGKAGYDTVVTGVAKEIVMDLDRDGTPEDYRLYDPTETTKDIHIKKDGEPLDAGATVTKGQATVNVATFYYVRCTQTMTVTKEVVDNSAELDPDPNRSFDFSLLIHATGYHKNSYAYTKTDGTVGTLTPEITAPDILRFTLKAGETITIEGLPTAEYTVSELNLPTGYYDVSGTNVKNKLTVDAQVDITVVNSFEPANLTITKTVDVVEEDTNTPEIQEFAFTVTVPSGVTGSYDYSVGGTTRTATVSGGKITVMLKNGETATFLNLPTGAYAVTETDYSAYGYDSNYSVNGAAFTEGQTANVTLVRDTTQAVRFENEFPVGDLVIEKTVNKEFYGTDWSGDTFTFTVERTTAGRPLIAGNQYKVLLDGVEQSAKADVVDGKLTLTLSFSEEDAAKLTAADSSVKHTLTIKNLPAGTYTVEENTDADYVQTPEGLTVSNLTIPAESTTASFTNTVKRKYGKLYLEKELEVLTGYMPPMEEIKFSFILELLEEIPAQDQTFQVAYSSDAYSDGTATATAVTMSGGKLTLTLEANQNVTVTGLPEGKYRITEATVPYYANAFAYKVEDQWVPQTSTTTEEGQMYTEFDVEPEGTARIKCTNTYPVDRAELIIQKLVTKEYARDTLPGGEYTFTVTLAEADMDSYTYKVYGKNGGFVREATAAADGKKVFTIKLEADQYAVIPGMPVCGYTVAETVDTTDYNVSYSVYVSKTGDVPSTTVTTGTASDSGTGTSVSRTFAAGNTDAVVFTNRYKRHLGTLTISKKVTDTGAKDTFIFHIKGKDEANKHIDMDVAITGSGSVTIYDLPLGSYTVTEDTSWSWRYNLSSSDTTDNTITLDDLHAVVIFTNTHENDKWLNYTANMPNVFGKKEDEKEGS